MSIRVAVQNASAAARVPPPRMIRSWARAALARLRRERGELNVRIVDEAEIAALNRTYRNKPGATNVLSFPFENPPHLHTDILGDVVICAPVVMREAVAPTTAQAHWAHIVVHGVLHLCGHDHQHDEEAREMENLEAAILGDCGFANPYDAAADGAP